MTILMLALSISIRPETACLVGNDLQYLDDMADPHAAPSVVPLVFEQTFGIAEEPWCLVQHVQLTSTPAPGVLCAEGVHDVDPGVSPDRTLTGWLP